MQNTVQNNSESRLYIMYSFPSIYIFKLHSFCGFRVLLKQRNESQRESIKIMADTIACPPQSIIFFPYGFVQREMCPSSREGVIFT